MEKKSLKNIFFRRMIHGERKMDIEGNEAIFLVLATLVEIGFPIYFLFAKHKMEFPMNLFVLLGTLVALFFIFMDLRTFFQKNYFDLIFFQLGTYLFFMLIGLGIFIWKKQDIARIAELENQTFFTWFVTIFLYLIFVLASFLLVTVIDFLVVFVLLLLASIFRVNYHNDYMEKLHYAQSLEGFEEYTRKRLREEYEGRFQEGSIDEASFEQYCKQQSAAEPGFHNQEALFEDTKYFRQISSLEQVKTRYDMLMEIYQSQEGSSSEICKEIEQEYKKIKKKYHLKDES